MYICIGKIGKIIGISKRKFRCMLFVDDINDVKNINNFYINKNKIFQRIPNIHFEKKANKFICYFSNTDSVIYDFNFLVNKELYILRESLNLLKDDEFYVVDLIGCSAILNSQVFGYVKDISNYGSCNLFHIEGVKGNYFYVPFLKENIKSIDFDNKTISFINIEGFLEV